MSVTIHDDAAVRKHAGSFYAPVEAEVEAFDLPVTGAIPPGLAGRFVRNGPNARGGDPHPFMAEGMLHGIRLEHGSARWYRNRWMRTHSFETDAPYVRADGTLDLTAGPANTNAIAHGGKLLALVESSFPYEFTRELDTLDAYDFGGKLATPFTAHPKRCPRTGELHAFGMSMLPPGLTYHRIDAAGTLIESRSIPVRGVTMMHDFALTDRHVIFMDLPVVFDFARAASGEMPYAWSDTYGARLGVLRRDDPAAEVCWFDIEPCYAFHVLNAYDDAGTIVVDVVRYPELWRNGARTFEPAALHRWTIDLAAARVGESPLDDTAIEFPRADERRLGSAYRFGYAAEWQNEERAGIRKYDLTAATSTRHDFGAGRFTGEPVFVAATDDVGEDAGWLMTFVYDAARNASDFVIVDASDLKRPPIATIALPQRVPAGFHGNWIDDAQLR